MHLPVVCLVRVSVWCLRILLCALCVVACQSCGSAGPHGMQSQANTQQERIRPTTQPIPSAHSQAIPRPPISRCRHPTRCSGPRPRSPEPALPKPQHSLPPHPQPRRLDPECRLLPGPDPRRMDADPSIPTLAPRRPTPHLDLIPAPRHPCPTPGLPTSSRRLRPSTCDPRLPNPDRRPRPPTLHSPGLGLWIPDLGPNLEIRTSDPAPPTRAPRTPTGGPGP